MGVGPAATSKRLRSPGRKRRVAGWVLLVVGVVIAGVWGASRWWWFGWSGEQESFAVFRGLASIDTQRGNVWSPLGWCFDPAPSPHDVGWVWLTETPTNTWNATQFVNLHFASYQRLNVISSGFSNSGQVIGTEHSTYICIWPFALVSLLGGGWLVWSGRRARRRAMTGVCLKCGYDLRGLGAGAPCPECGKQVAAAEA